MGGPMANRLLQAGQEVVVFDLDPKACGELAKAGADIAPDAGSVAAASTVIVASLPSAEISEAVASEITEHLRTAAGETDCGEQAGSESLAVQKYFLDTTTSYPESSRRAAATLSAVGVTFLDAPVSGGRQGATDGTLSIMIGGPGTAVEACTSVLEVLGTTITHFGEQVGAGGYAKLANQIIVSLHHTALAEAFAFARDAGLDLAQLVPALQAGWAASTVLDVKAPKILAQDYSPIGSVAIQNKDLAYILEAAEGLGLGLPGSTLVKDQFATLLARGDGSLDQMALMHLYETSAPDPAPRTSSGGSGLDS